MRSPFFWLSCIVLAAALAFGGAARQGLASDAIPELASLPLLALALPRATPHPGRAPIALALVAGVVILPLAQLIPLPPWLWSAMPGRQIVVEILATAGAPLTWRPISLIPSATWRAFFSLMPAAAIFLAVLSLDRMQRNMLLLLAVSIGVASVPIAMLQALDGPNSELYFFAVTNVGRGVGFFANANHFGAFEYSLLPLAAAALAELRARSLAFLLAVIGGVVPALLFGMSLSGSRTAIVLGALSAAATLSLVLMPELVRLGRLRFLALFAAFALALLPLLLGLGMLEVLERFASDDVAEDARWRIAASTWDGISSFFPFGAGLGTFPVVYPLHERVADLIPEFVNRAHDDLLETLFEGGATSLGLLLGFVVWLSIATYRAFFRAEAYEERQARAGVIVMCLLLLHSLWDYPLRTIALATVFSLCAGSQFAPPPSQEHRGFRWPFRRRRKRRRRLHSGGSVKAAGKPGAQNEPRAQISRCLI